MQRIAYLRILLGWGIYHFPRLSNSEPKSKDFHTGVDWWAPTFLGLREYMQHRQGMRTHGENGGNNFLTYKTG
jgi:hypothetical protein